MDISSIAPSTTQHARRTVVSYVRRSPRMTASQRNWYHRLAPSWVLDVQQADLATTVAPQPHLDLDLEFGHRAPLIIEIGSGHGDALVQSAASHPENNYLGFEVFEASLAVTLGKIDAAQVHNARLLGVDAMSGMTYLIPDHTVDEIWVFFPDPWPKKRHHKRRLVSPEFADLVRQKLVTSGILRLATDSAAYADHIVDTFGADHHFELISTERFAARPLTKFEKRGLEAGRAIHDFTYQVGDADA